MKATAALLLALVLPARAAEFVLPRVDFGAMRGASVPGLKEGTPQGAPQPGPALVVLKLVNRSIAAESEWTGVPEGMRRALIEVAPAEGSSVPLGEVSLEVAEVRNGSGYRPGDGSLKPADRTGSEWVYTPFSEPKTEKHPKTLSVVVVPKHKGRIVGEPVQIEVKAVFAQLTLFHSHAPRSKPHGAQPDDYELAWRYAKWKYGLDTTASTSIRYDPKLNTMGITNPGAFNIGRNVRLGPTAFASENICASVIGHENVHSGQSLATLLSSRWAEPPAYQWEMDNAARLGTDDSYLAELKAFKRWYEGKGPKPDL